MLYLQFQIDNQRYVMGTNDVITLMPVVEIEAVPNMPAYIPGVINYKGDIIPVVDIAQQLCDRPANRFLSTRIVLVRIKFNDHDERTLGVLMEKVSEVIKIDDSSFQESSHSSEKAPLVNSVFTGSEGVVHRVEASTLLADSDLKLVFGTSH